MKMRDAKGEGEGKNGTIDIKEGYVEFGVCNKVLQLPYALDLLVNMQS